MMNYSELIKNNRIKKGQFSEKQIKDCMNIARRDIETARKIVNHNPDWGYSIAYNSMLQTFRALMFSRGYRAIGEGMHITTIQFAQMTLSDEFSSMFEYIDGVRRKRHRTVYDMAGLVSTKEASEAIEIAETVFKTIAEILNY